MDGVLCTCNSNPSYSQLEDSIGDALITGNPIFNQRVAAMTTQSRPLYTFEIPDEGLIVTSFNIDGPDSANVTVDVPNLITQPLWFIAALKAAGLRSVALVPTTGFILQPDDGLALSVPPTAQVERFNYGPTVIGASAYMSWNGIEYPPGMQDIAKAVSIDLVLVSSLTESGGYLPYASVGYSVNGIPAELATWFSALLDNSPGWAPRTDTLRLWPGNVHVGAAMPDINKVQIQVSQIGTATGSSPFGNVFSVTPTLVVSFL